MSMKRLCLLLATCLLLSGIVPAFAEEISAEAPGAAPVEESLPSVGENAEAPEVAAPETAEGEAALPAGGLVEEAVPEAAGASVGEDASAADEAESAAPQAAAETPEAPAAEEAPAAQAEAAEEAPAVTEALAATEIVLTRNAKRTVTMGDALQIRLGSGTARKFASSNRKVATVSAEGLVNTLRGGKAKITVTTAKKKKLTLTLTVVDPTVPTGVSLTLNGETVTGTITVNKGEPITLTPVAVAPGEASTGFKWSTSNKKVAAVSGGVVTPKKEGSATITVKTTRGGKKKKLKLKVVDPYKAKAVRLDRTGLVYMTVGSTMQLTATMTPENSTSALKWSSSAKKIASVGKNGLVTARKKGLAVITVKTSTGKKARVSVRVLAKAGSATGMTGEWVTLAEDNTLNPGDLYTYIVSMKPVNADADVVWSSENPGVIRVENAYRGDDLKYLAEVRAVDLGYARLTATDRVSGLSRSVVLYVKPGSEPTSISFPNLDNRPMAVGEKRNILYQVDPQDSLSHDANRATVSYDTAVLSITYDSNNAARNCRGTMDYNLHITAKAPGTTTVTVALKNGVKNSFEITVK